MIGDHPIRLTHVITGLNHGGAEFMLLRLLSRFDREMFACHVISLTSVGSLGQQIVQLGIPVTALGMRRGVPPSWHFLKLVRVLREQAPDLVQTWMYHADLLGSLAAMLARVGPVVWSIRHTDLDPQANKRTTVWVARICASLSHSLPKRIVTCSEISRRAHVQVGYAGSKMVVIPNGFDTSVFKPDPAARASVRRELGLPDDALLIGLFGRFHPQKDHHNFVRAAALVRAQFSDVHFLLCGEGITWRNVVLAEWIRASGASASFHLLGQRDDMPRLNAALDIAVLSSRSEGFPNVVGEAMACGVPCVVTDAGGTAELVGETGIVVPPRDPEALAAGLVRLIEAGPEIRAQVGAAARQRIEHKFGLDVVVARYQTLYQELIKDVRASRSI